MPNLQSRSLFLLPSFYSNHSYLGVFCQYFVTIASNHKLTSLNTNCKYSFLSPCIKSRFIYLYCSRIYYLFRKIFAFKHGQKLWNLSYRRTDRYMEPWLLYISVSVWYQMTSPSMASGVTKSMNCFIMPVKFCLQI